MKRTVPILVAAIIATACAPRLYEPHVETPRRYVYADGFSVDTASMQARWWELFGDTTLNRLVERALEYNRDLRAAASRVRQARAELAVARARYLPQVGIGVEAEGEYTHPTGIEQTYAIEPTLQWEVSLFGALENATRAARARISQTLWAYRGMRLSVASQVATTYFTLLEYRRDLMIARRSAQLRRESAALIDSMFRYGMSNGVALAQAQSLVYSAEADIAQYRRAVEQTHLSLRTLLGETPSRADTDDTGINLLTDRHPVAIPVGLPSGLLRRRPDVLEAAFNLSAAAANAGAARSARFPSLTLTAKGGIASNSIKGLTGAHPWAWDALGQLVEPIFAFGRLRRSEQAAVEQYNQAARDYEQTVLTAFADVEQALTAITTTRAEIERINELVRANQSVATMTHALYRSGMSAYLDVIDAERSLYQSQMELVNRVAQQYINYVSLCTALGGGWEASLPPATDVPE